MNVPQGPVAGTHLGQVETFGNGTTFRTQTRITARSTQAVRLGTLNGADHIRS